MKIFNETNSADKLDDHTRRSLAYQVADVFNTHPGISSDEGDSLSYLHPQAYQREVGIIIGQAIKIISVKTGASLAGFQLDVKKYIN
jgi:hypothetical protein